MVRNRLFSLPNLGAVLATGVSALGSLALLPLRLPGMELAGIAPDWPLIWVVAWSVKRTPWQGLIAGVTLGILQDALVNPGVGWWPSHALGLGVAGFLTALLQKDRLIQEDFISVALIVFAMAAISETLMAVQWSILGHRPLGQIWLDHQRLTLASAILSSLWAPLVYMPLSRLWQSE
ncbi:PEP-CTERM putative exosortase interaction domain protein [Gloeomargarita lithophora Alchichica-D10]|uniref:PEP-CTERM putative exosortase interaction domain protein n=1 Tax=Gloeomargarita lithophora Alchichica-D10 TaxID=1188229 RepID=A0A1J0AE87_9CYAN|nr:rod shape-determining protein MreD [Gloeomargarita lithophora]APB34223.1 PEP-CTERM putative exosortase interaction domain protein [Gloeomargarita lithophora Alchichica-D10]